MLPSIRELALCSHPRYPFRATVGKGTQTLEQSASLQISFLSEGCPEVVHSGGIFPMKGRRLFLLSTFNTSVHEILQHVIVSKQPNIPS
jgi:hypothetical protein